MAGISGHAGLFSNATDLAVLASAMFCGGAGEHRFFRPNVIDLFTSPGKEGTGTLAEHALELRKQLEAAFGGMSDA